MSNIVTIYPGPVGHQDQFILDIYNRLVASPPSGYTVLQHSSIDDLCQQLGNLGSSLGTAEILSHANPYYLGVILVDNVSQVAQAIQSASVSSRIFLTGCNSGTWTSATDTTDIATYLASGAPSQVYGSLGYLDGGTIAEGTVNSSTDDWGRPGAAVYLGSVNASGMNAYALKPRTTTARMMTAIPPTTPVEPTHPAISHQAKTLVTRLLTNLSKRAPSQLAVNGQTAPDFRISFNGQIYDFLYSCNVVRRESSGATWNLDLTPQQKALLQSISMPRAAGVAVVGEHVPEPLRTS
jgi:hypothetical protein